MALEPAGVDLQAKGFDKYIRNLAETQKMSAECSVVQVLYIMVWGCKERHFTCPSTPILLIKSEKTNIRSY